VPILCVGDRFVNSRRGLLLLLEKDQRITEGQLDSKPAAGLRDSKAVPHGGSRQSGACLPAHILIVADDLTGACDAAAAFLASGRRVRVLLDASGCDSPNTSADVLAVTTESRSLSAGGAPENVGRCFSRMASAAADALLFKKIDSAARDNCAAEVDAALRASGAALAVVTPAFPRAGRTVARGILSVRDWTGQNTMVDLREMFRTAELDPVILQTASEEELHRSILCAMSEGKRILLCDAAMQEDLDRLASAALRVAQRILWAGSAGLARALAAHLPSPSAQLTGTPARRVGRTALFTGTPHPVTALQIAHLEQCSASRPHERPPTIHRFTEAETMPGAVVADAFAAAPAGALILTGGDTASFVLRALGATGIRLAGEIAPGIPWGIAEGGTADGCTVVTKSGGFGQRDALVRAFEFCESQSEAAPAP
jgi:D-threonate/D-erythronate kinase